MRHIILLFFILTFLSSKAQNTGYSFTINGQIIDYQLHPYNNVTVDLSNILNIQTDFIPGKIFYSNGSIEEMKLKLLDGNFLFTKSGNSDEKVELAEIKSFTIASDSFLIISQREIFPERKKDKYLVFGFLDETEKFLLFMHQNGSTEKYYLKDKTNNQWIDCNILGQDYFQKEIIVKYFYTPPVIARPSEFAKSDLPQVFKMQKYYEYFLNNNKIYFEVGLNETDDPKKANQYATIDNIENGNWEFTFYAISGIKTMNGTFSSIFPFDRDGQFEWYYPDGKVRARSIYRKDKLEGLITAYSSDGKVQGEYKHVGKNDLQMYDKLYDNQGNLLGKSVLQYQQVTDNFSNRDLLMTYNDGILTTVTYNENNEIVYLLPVSASKFKDKEDLVYPEEALKNGTTGIVVLRIKLNDEGDLVEKSIVFASNEILSVSVNDYFSDGDNYKFSPGKVKGQKVSTEFLFFVQFNIISNYIKKYNNNWMNEIMRQQQQHLQNQMLIQSINPPKF